MGPAALYAASALPTALISWGCASSGFCGLGVLVVVVTMLLPPIMLFKSNNASVCPEMNLDRQMQGKCMKTGFCFYSLVY
jgi:hypothetical protein